MKLIRRLSLGLLLLCVLPMCREDVEKREPRPALNLALNLMIDPDDPLLFEATTENGYHVQYFGQRGETSRMTSMMATNTTDTLIYEFDEISRINKMITNEAHTQFDWIDDTHVGVLVTSRDGQTQINTVMDLSSSGNSGGRVATNGRIGNIRGGKKATLTMREGSRDVEQNNARTAAEGTVTVEVESCGAAASASVFVAVRKQITGDHVITIPATSVSHGTYQASIPTNKPPDYEARKLCLTFSHALETVCRVNSLLLPGQKAAICADLTAIAATIGTPAAAIIVGSVCGGLSLATDLACRWSGKGKGASLLCEAATEDRTYSDVSIMAYAVGIPQNIYSQSVLVDEVTAGNLTIDLDLGSTPKVQSVTLSPIAPTSGIDYNATATATCLPVGASVTLSVKGTDGWEDVISRSIAVSRPSDEFILTVPGAATGVHDTIIFTITLPSGESIQRVATLVFS